MANSYFDCTKTTDFYHEIRRMCKTYPECYNDEQKEYCPLCDFFDNNDDECGVTNIADINKKTFLKIMATVQQWSDSHPATETELIKQGKVSVSDYLNCTEGSPHCGEISW